MVALAYTSKLNDAFDRIFVRGVAEIARADLLLWHDNQQRVTKRLWRNIQDAWEVRCKTQWEYKDAEIPQLLRAYSPETLTYIMIWGGEPDEKTGKILPWFKSLAEVDEAEENEAANEQTRSLSAEGMRREDLKPRGAKVA